MFITLSPLWLAALVSLSIFIGFIAGSYLAVRTIRKFHLVN